MTRRIRIGLALGSGGARALAHAGVLEVLEAEGLVPDFISGTSMGAIVGGLYAETADAGETWQRLAAFVEDEDFLKTWRPFIPQGSGEDDQVGPVQSLMTSLNRAYYQIRTVTTPNISDEKRLRRPLESMFRARTFEELQLPFAAVGIDLIGGEKVVFSSGDLITGVYASSAVPGVFPPVTLGDKVVVDAGAPFRVPVNTCQEMGADIVIGVTIPTFTSSKPEYKTGLSMAQRCEALASNRLDRYVMSLTDAAIRPDVSSHHWADFRGGAEMRECGIKAAQEALPQIHAAIKAAEQARFGWRARVRRIFA
jgi:NTE family protein